MIFGQEKVHLQIGPLWSCGEKSPPWLANHPSRHLSKSESPWQAQLSFSRPPASQLRRSPRMWGHLPGPTHIIYHFLYTNSLKYLSLVVWEVVEKSLWVAGGGSHILGSAPTKGDNCLSRKNHPEPSTSMTWGRANVPGF